MKQFSNIFLLTFCVAVLLCSCSKAKQITLSETDTVTFAITGGEKSIPVTADGSYDIKDCPDWVKAVASDSALIITVTQNTTGAPRKCIIRLVGDNIGVPFTIQQADKCTYIKVSETEVTLPKEGGSKEVIIDTDGGNIAVDIADFQPKDGGQSLLNAKISGNKLVINGSANKAAVLKGQIKLSCDTVACAINVAIEGELCPTCKGKGIITCTKCKGKGEYEISDCYYGCKMCGGRGVVGPGLGVAEEIVNGKGRITCPDCGGKGR